MALEIGNKPSIKLFETGNTGIQRKQESSYAMNLLNSRISSKQSQINFGQENSNQAVQPKKDSNKALKVAGTLAGIAVLGAITINFLKTGKFINGITKSLNEVFNPAVNAEVKNAKRTAKLAAKLEKKAKILREKIETVVNNSNTQGTINADKLGNSFGDQIVKFGLFMDRITSNRKELINNLIYGVGTLIVMPLVIIFSPFGSKKSSKEDKIFTVLRQPISFATTFGMQFTVDKFFKMLIPKLEELRFLPEKYLSKDAAGNKLVGQALVDATARLKGLKEGSAILFNLITLPISCTMLNYLYGKFMKYLRPDAALASQEIKKGGSK